MSELMVKDFLEARIAEDETRALSVRCYTPSMFSDQEPVTMRSDEPFPRPVREVWDHMDLPEESKRTILEVASKRGVIREITLASESLSGRGVNVPFFLTWILFHMASVYRDHPDFNQEWSMA